MLLYKPLSMYLLLFCFAGSVIAQSSFGGKVIDINTNRVIPGATITVKGLDIQTMSDVDGLFTIIVPDVTAVVIVASIGYTAEEFQLSPYSFNLIKLGHSASSWFALGPRVEMKRNSIPGSDNQYFNYGVSSKFYFWKIMSFELHSVSNFKDFANVNLTLEIHPIRVKNARVFIGYGPNFALYENITAFGFSGITGVEYTHKKIPLNLSVDINPVVDQVLLNNRVGMSVGYGITLRYDLTHPGYFSRKAL